MTGDKRTARERAHDLVAQMTLAEKCAQMKYDAPAIPRLGVPAYNWWNEALHGVARSGAATVFPQAIGLAATFDVDGVKGTAAAISDEMRAKYNQYRTFGETQIYQGITAWSPNINIFRDPRWATRLTGRTPTSPAEWARLSSRDCRGTTRCTGRWTPP